MTADRYGTLISWRAAVVADLGRYRLKAVIDGYDFNRPNK